MRAEIVIDQGQAKLAKPLYLKPDAPNRYTIEIPDEALAETRDWYPGEAGQPPATTPPRAEPGSLQGRFNRILGDLARTRPAASIGDDYQMLQDALEERYLGC